ncbi:MAG: ABC transporter permease [Luteolibacter sp.]
MLVAFAGGVLSFTGVAVGAMLVVPPVLRLVGRVLGGSVPARLAAEKALHHPERSSRMAIGVVIGVTLVTTIAVALESMRKEVIADGLGRHQPPEPDDDALTTFATVMSTVVAVSAVIAAVGLVNLLTLGVVERRRELGLLRTLGLSAAQVRGMVLLEAAHVTVTAVLIGLVLGIFYGWAGAQATFGSRTSPARDPSATS